MLASQPMNELDKLLRLSNELYGCRDAALLRLPHPQRVALARPLNEYMFKDMLGPKLYQKMVQLLGEDRLTASVSGELSAIDNAQGFRDLALATSRLGGQRVW